MPEPRPSGRVEVESAKAAMPAKRQRPGDRSRVKDRFINFKLRIPPVFTSFYLTIVAGPGAASPLYLASEAFSASAMQASHGRLR